MAGVELSGEGGMPHPDTHPAHFDTRHAVPIPRQ